MVESLLHLLPVAACIGAAMVAGIFYGFSTFVMKALARLNPPCGISAMQSINLAVLNPLFFLAFLGTAGLCLASGIVAILRWQPNAVSHAVLLGAILYIVGTLGVTAGFNVPLNERLRVVSPDSASAVALWAHYLRRWTLWNHVRTLAALMSAGAFAYAIA